MGFETGNEGSAAIDNAGNIIFGSADNNVYSLSSTGSINWVYTTGGYVYGTPVVGADGSIYFGSRDNMFYALAMQVIFYGARTKRVSMISMRLQLSFRRYTLCR